MRAFSTTSTVLLAALVTLASTGCLQKTVVNSVYISPSGVVVSIMETDIRSDERDPGDRLNEENAFLSEARVDQHSAAKSLRELGGRSLKTTWIRRERPYGLITEARFADLRSLALAVIRDSGAAGNASLTRDGCDTVVKLWVNVDAGDDKKNSAIGEDGDDLKSFRFILTEGRFTAADGFTIENDGAIAVPDADKKLDDGVLTLMLRWTEDVTCRPRSS